MNLEVVMVGILTRVKFYHFVAPGTGETHSGNIKIYEAGTLTSPGALVTSEPYTVSGEGWFTICLSSPVVLDDDEDVWVSVEVAHAAGEYPLGTDVGPAVDGKGDWVSNDGGASWDELQGFGLDRNWNIWAKVCGGDDTTPPETVCLLEGEMEGDVFVSDVTVTLDVFDEISGVNYTMYKLDDDDWGVYVESFVVLDGVEHTVYFYSVDNAGNVEEEKSCTFTIKHPIEIEFKSGFGVTVIVGNTGEEDITNLNYSIVLDGGLILFGGEKTGTMYLAAGVEVPIKSFVFGFGRPTITVKAELMGVIQNTKTVNGFVVGPFVIIK